MQKNSRSTHNTQKHTTQTVERARKGGADLRDISCRKHNMATPNHGGLISIIEKFTFMRNLPASWTRGPKDGQGGSESMKTTDSTTEGSEFTVLVHDKDFQGMDNCFEINDADDLQAAREVIMRGPIFTTVKCTKKYWTDHDTKSEVRQYVVLVNTGHPGISSEVERAFELAERLRREGRNFRITISISKSLEQFYNQNVIVPYDNHKTTAEFCDIYLTHGVKRPNWADSHFTCETFCESSVSICQWICCFPSCLLGGVPYLCYKKCYKDLIEESFLQALPIVEYTGPLQAGYNLRSLLNSPAGI